VAEQTIRTALEPALDAYAVLASLGEEIEDEWSYVNDLADAWRDRLESVVDARGETVATDAEVAAIERAIEEIGLITDAHRAIDWLSTFPQLVLVAVGEDL
jgi:hypothetical protein